jgi:nitroreductase/NAD-dependent dihydropyrimidine dehydrogenase PreA subunit
MFKIKKEVCIGCGICVQDCFVRAINVLDGKAEINQSGCYGCGHCLAICPQNAVTQSEYDIDEIIDYDPATCDIEPKRLLRFFKFRRSIRQFDQTRELSDEHVHMLFEAGRHMPTGSNSQGVRYILTSRETTKKIVELNQQFYGDFVSSPDFSVEKYPYTAWTAKYARALKKWKRVYDETGEDLQFRTAPQLLFFVCDYENMPGYEVDSLIAMTAIELMAHSLGIGALYIGVAGAGVQMNPKVRDLLGLNEGDYISMCLGLGYPTVKYLRSCPRKPANWQKI